MIYNVHGGALNLTQLQPQVLLSAITFSHNNAGQVVHWRHQGMARCLMVKASHLQSARHGLDSRFAAQKIRALWWDSISNSTGPGPGVTSPVQRRFGSVWDHFLDQTRSMCSICSVVCCLFHINRTWRQPQKKKAIDITASIAWISYVVERKCMYATFSASEN